MTPTQIKNLTKRYYTIREVAEMFDVSKSLIRFWEQEFTILKPHKTKSGERKFTPKNIEQFQQIYVLVKEKGFTLAGAKKELQTRKSKSNQKREVLKKLKEIRYFLMEIREEMKEKENSKSIENQSFIIQNG